MGRRFRLPCSPPLYTPPYSLQTDSNRGTQHCTTLQAHPKQAKSTASAVLWRGLGEKICKECNARRNSADGGVRRRCVPLLFSVRQPRRVSTFGRVCAFFLPRRSVTSCHTLLTPNKQKAQPSLCFGVVWVRRFELRGLGEKI